MSIKEIDVIRVQAARLALPLTPVAALGQEQERSGTGSQARGRGGLGQRALAVSLIAFCRSKTVSKAVHAPPADGPCRKAGTVCVGVNLISADCTPGVSVAVSVRAY